MFKAITGQSPPTQLFSEHDLQICQSTRQNLYFPNVFSKAKYLRKEYRKLMLPKDEHLDVWTTSIKKVTCS